MTREQINVALASILETLVETDDGAAPEGVLYAALMHRGYSFEDFMLLRRLMTTAGLVQAGGHALRLTATGKDMAAKVAAFHQERRA